MVAARVGHWQGDNNQRCYGKGATIAATLFNKTENIKNKYVIHGACTRRITYVLRSHTSPRTLAKPTQPTNTNKHKQY
jgi:hypothetical protein